jgi:hypothetical protein
MCSKSYFAVAGSIPTEFGELINLKFLALASNELAGTTAFAHFALFGTQVYHLLKNDLPLALAGSIPTEFGKLINLIDLALFENTLTCKPRLLVSPCLVKASPIC